MGVADISISPGSSQDRGQAAGSQQITAEQIENIQNSFVMALGSSIDQNPYISGEYETSQDSELDPIFSTSDEDAVDLAASLWGDVSKEGGGAFTRGASIGIKNDDLKKFISENYILIGGVILIGYLGYKYMKKKRGKNNGVR